MGRSREERFQRRGWWAQPLLCYIWDCLSNLRLGTFPVPTLYASSVCQGKRNTTSRHSYTLYHLTPAEANAALMKIAREPRAVSDRSLTYCCKPGNIATLDDKFMDGPVSKQAVRQMPPPCQVSRTPRQQNSPDARLMDRGKGCPNSHASIHWHGPPSSGTPCLISPGSLAHTVHLFSLRRPLLPLHAPLSLQRALSMGLARLQMRQYSF